MPVFTIVFFALLALMLAAQWWLAWRQVRYVAAHRAQVPAAFENKIDPSAHAKAADYTIARVRLGAIDAGLSVLLLAAWTAGGGLEWLDHVWRGLGWNELVTGAAFLLSLILIGALLDLPFSIYRIFVLESRFGFNKTTPALFVSDLVKQLALAVVIGVPLLFAVLWLMQSMGTQWWLWVWLLWTGFTVAMYWAYPALIAPLFNRFRPLDRAELAARIHALLARTGFRSRGVFVMDGSRRSAHGNAYFTGLGRNKRIVFFDTLLDSLNEVEVEAVLAHELGHFKRKHVLKRMLLSFVLSLAGLALLGWLIAQPAFYHTFGVSQPSNYAALALFLMVSPVFGFWLQPLFAWGSRRDEFEADAFAAQESDAHALMSALVKLYEENASTLTPDPVYSAFYNSHPPALRRIAHLQTLSAAG